MFKATIKNYTIFLIISIVGFAGVIISTLVVPESLKGYGGITTAIMLVLFGYHIFFYSKELKRLKKEAENQSTK